MAQVVECLPNKQEVLNLNPSTTNKQKNPTLFLNRILKKNEDAEKEEEVVRETPPTSHRAEWKWKAPLQFPRPTTLHYVTVLPCSSVFPMS
jgi:hypothetical protein